MTNERLDEIVTAMRSPEGWASGIDELNEAFLLLADIRAAERALRKAEAANTGPFADSGTTRREAGARAALRALGVDP